MVILSIDYAQKLRAIRKAEKLTQKKFSDITGLALGTVRKYESGHQSARAEIMEKVLQVDLFEKYTLWLIHGKTSEAAGQIAAPIDEPGDAIEIGDDEHGLRQDAG
ncbi:helix-turn-helix domain-containing protein [Serratia marcescens]|uniref:helix-turn-helix domain-containing protein n=1 Tax=Serratia marcescens TaxID=615 RepID=UPI0013DBC2EB|nr:helix-turn-helix transcriptional regulator [Serratia marcescens]